MGLYIVSYLELVSDIIIYHIFVELSMWDVQCHVSDFESLPPQENMATN